MDTGDGPGPEIAKKRDSAILVLDAKKTARWKEAAQKVTEALIAEMKGKRITARRSSTTPAPSSRSPPGRRTRA